MTFKDVPPVGIYLDRYHRYWWNGKGPIPSVTTVTGVIAKPYLINWAANKAAERAVARADLLFGHMSGHATLVPECEVCIFPLKEEWTPAASATRWVAAASSEHRDEAAGFGTRVHGHAEAITYGVSPLLSDEERPAVEAYLRWRDRYQPEEIEAEFAVVSLKHDFAGTGDQLARIQGYLTMVDFKSGKSIPSEIDLQLSAYSNADGIARPNARVLEPMPVIERHAVLHIRPDAYEQGYSFDYVAVTSRSFQRFLDARRLWTWNKAKQDEYRRNQQGAAA